MPRKTFVGGEILLASELNGFLMDQSVMVFDDATDRATAIPTPVEGMTVYLSDTDSLQTFDGSNFTPAANTASILDAAVTTAKIGNGQVTRAKLAGGLAAFTQQVTITGSNSSFSVPALGSPIVKVTVIGGGGGGGGAGFNSNTGATGGTTTFNPVGTGSVSAPGGLGGRLSSFGQNQSRPGNVGTPGFANGNGGQGGERTGGGEQPSDGANGNGGQIRVGYLNLSGVSTVNVTIGGGGAGGAGGQVGATGGRGEVILEFVAA